MDFEACRSLTAAFFEQASRRQQDPFLWHKQDGRYRPQSWAEVARQVTDFSRGLRSLGLQPGERVFLVAEYLPEWLVADQLGCAHFCTPFPYSLLVCRLLLVFTYFFFFFLFFFFFF